MRTSLIIAATLPVVALAAPGLDALCEGKRLADIVVNAHEFAIIGYDVEAQALAVRPPRTLLSDKHGWCRLQLEEEHVLVPMDGPMVQFALDAWRTSALDLRVRVERQDPDRPPAKVTCQQLAPRTLSLQIGDYVLARRDLAKPVQPNSNRMVHVGAVLAEPWVRPFSTDRLRNAVYLQSFVCLRQLGAEGLGVRGSISIELKTTTEGRAMRPTLAVDGLVNRPLTHCLLREIGESSMVWKDLPDNAQIYVPVFFRAGEPPPALPPPDSVYINATFINAVE